MSSNTSSQSTPETDTSSASSTQAGSTVETSASAPEQETTNPPTGDEQQTPPTEDTEPDEQEPGDESTKAGREAKKYRLQLRQVEAERDQMRERLEGAAANVIDAKLGNANISTKGLKAAGVDLATVFNDDGSFSDEKLLQAATGAVEKLGIHDPNLSEVAFIWESRRRIDWTRTAAMGYVPTAGTGGEKPLSGNGWQDVINGRS